MDLQLHNQHVLVTGGSRGIGLACARQFLAEGARVTLVARTPASLASAQTELDGLVDGPSRVRTLVSDLQDPNAAAHMVAQAQSADTGWGPVDVLVNCAGAAQRTPPDELTPAAWHAAMLAKFFSYIHVTDPLIKQMGQRGRGVVVNVVGMGGKVASPIHLPGGSANAALMLASAGLAAAYAPMGVRVNVVNPALTQTERLTEGLAAEARLLNTSPAEVLARTVAKYPMGRIAQPAEIANAVVFLASPRASYINGVALSMDGATTPLVA
jgi:NAD(P)-dependent dehydrogenase (short-subunit alcohol dehydrogenase family)